MAKMIADYRNATPNPTTWAAATAAPIASGVWPSGGLATRKDKVAVPMEPHLLRGVDHRAGHPGVGMVDADQRDVRRAHEDEVHADRDQQLRRQDRAE